MSVTHEWTERGGVAHYSGQVSAALALKHEWSILKERKLKTIDYLALDFRDAISFNMEDHEIDIIANLVNEIAEIQGAEGAGIRFACIIGNDDQRRPLDYYASKVGSGILDVQIFDSFAEAMAWAAPDENWRENPLRPAGD